MKLIRAFFLLALLAVAVLGAGDNPYSIWCDYHNTYSYKQGQEYPSGVCYDVYSHPYYDSSCRCQMRHRTTVKCAR